MEPQKSLARPCLILQTNKDEPERLKSKMKATPKTEPRQDTKTKTIKIFYRQIEGPGIDPRLSALSGCLQAVPTPEQIARHFDIKARAANNQAQTLTDKDWNGPEMPEKNGQKTGPYYLIDPAAFNLRPAVYSFYDKLARQICRSRGSDQHTAGGRARLTAQKLAEYVGHKHYLPLLKELQAAGLIKFSQDNGRYLISRGPGGSDGIKENSHLTRKPRQITRLKEELTAAVKGLFAKIAAGEVYAPEDVTPEILKECIERSNARFEPLKRELEVHPEKVEVRQQTAPGRYIGCRVEETRTAAPAVDYEDFDFMAVVKGCARNNPNAAFLTEQSAAKEQPQQKPYRPTGGNVAGFTQPFAGKVGNN